MSSDVMTAWLRKQVEADLAAAKIISSGGFSPQIWDTRPPGQVNPEKTPGSDAVTVALGAEADAEEICGWVCLDSYNKLNNEPDAAYARDGISPFALIDDGRREVEHIIRHDPRNVVADCEAKLAILDYCAGDGSTEAALERGDISAVEYAADEAAGAAIVRFLVAAYKHRDGYQAGWGA